MKKIKLVLIDDMDRPEDIPTTHWPQLATLYTLKNVQPLASLKGGLGIELNEINLRELGGLHRFFRADRFGILEESWDDFNELLQESIKLNQISSEDLNSFVNKL